jgi:hypothetical protein
MLHNNEAPNFTFEGVADAKFGVRPITMGGEVWRSSHIKQVKQVPKLLGREFGAIQSGWHDIEPSPSFFASKNGSAGATVQVFKDQFQGKIVQRCLADFQFCSDSFLDRKVFCQAEQFHSSECHLEVGVH